MINAQDFAKRYVVVPAATTILLMTVVAAVSGVTKEEMVAEDGRIEVVDGRHLQTLTRSLPFEPGTTLHLINPNGKIEVTAWDRNEMHITAEKRMEVSATALGWLFSKLNIPIKTTEDMVDYFRKVDLRIEFEDGDLVVQTTIPTWKPNVNVSVSYAVKVPEETDLIIETENGFVKVAGIRGAIKGEAANGKLDFAGIQGPIDARTSNGAVVCTNVSGSVYARTANGSIRVEHPGDLAGDHSIDCETSNGSIVVLLGQDSGFEFVATTVNGRVMTSFAIDSPRESTMRRKRLEGTVGAGGPTVALRTLNGSITVESI